MSTTPQETDDSQTRAFEGRPADRKLFLRIYEDLQSICPSAESWRVGIAPITRDQLYVPDPRNRAAGEVAQLESVEGSLVVKYKVRCVYEFNEGPFTFDGRSLWSFEAGYPTILSLLKVTCFNDRMVISFEMVSEHVRGATPVYAKDEPVAPKADKTDSSDWSRVFKYPKRLLGDVLTTAICGLTTEQLEKLQSTDWDHEGEAPSRGESRRRDGSSTLDDPPKGTDGSAPGQEQDDMDDEHQSPRKKRKLEEVETQ